MTQGVRAGADWSVTAPFDVQADHLLAVFPVTQRCNNVLCAGYQTATCFKAKCTRLGCFLGVKVPLGSESALIDNTACGNSLSLCFNAVIGGVSAPLLYERSWRKLMFLI